MKKFMMTITLSTLSAACSTLTPPIARPIIEDHAQNQVNAFAIQPSRRMLLVKSNVNRQNDVPVTALKDGLLPDRAILMCAEASPDVTDDILASLALAASGKGPSDKGSTTMEANASLAHALATSGQVIFKRSQALQFYRDIAYHLCQAKANGFIKDEEFDARLSSAQENAVQLLAIEVPWLYLAQILSSNQQQALKTKFETSVDVAPNGTITVKFPELKTTVVPPDRTAASTTPAPAPADAASRSKTPADEKNTPEKKYTTNNR